MIAFYHLVVIVWVLCTVKVGSKLLAITVTQDLQSSRKAASFCT